MSVVGVVDGQGLGLSAPPAEKKKKVEKKSKLVKSDKPTQSTSASCSRLATVSTDQRFDKLDQKWSDRFNRLEALLFASTLDRPQQGLTFSTVMVAPTHSPMWVGRTPSSSLLTSLLLSTLTDLLHLNSLVPTLQLDLALTDLGLQTE